MSMLGYIFMPTHASEPIRNAGRGLIPWFLCVFVKTPLSTTAEGAAASAGGLLLHHLSYTKKNQIQLLKSSSGVQEFLFLCFYCPPPESWSPGRNILQQYPKTWVVAATSVHVIHTTERRRNCHHQTLLCTEGLREKRKCHTQNSEMSKKECVIYGTNNR